VVNFSVDDDVWSVFTMILTRHRIEGNIGKTKFFDIGFETFEDEFAKISFTFSSGADFYVHIFLLRFFLLYPRKVFFQKKFAKIFFSI